MRGIHPLSNLTIFLVSAIVFMIIICFALAVKPFNKALNYSFENGVMAWHPGFEWTGGGLVSNSGDLALWGW